MVPAMADDLDGPSADTCAEEQPAPAEQAEQPEQTAPEEPEAPVPVPVHVGPENPLSAFVKGGTHTEASARLYEESFREAEVRRDESDRDKAVARVPIEQGGGRMFAHRFTQSPEIPQAYFLLRFVNESGSPMDSPGFCLGDVYIEDWEHPDDLTVQLVCPMCVNDGHKHLQDCQIKIRMSNRRWHFMPHASRKEFVFAEGDGPPKTYVSAGIITESERFFCPHCNWAGRIVNNRIVTERR